MKRRIKKTNKPKKSKIRKTRRKLLQNRKMKNRPRMKLRIILRTRKLPKTLLLLKRKNLRR